MTLKTAGIWAVGLFLTVGIGQAARLLPNETSADVVDDRILSCAIDSTSEIEPSIAATKSGEVAVAWMSERGGKGGDHASYIGTRVSHDRGQTWQGLHELHVDDQHAAYPTVVFRDGAPQFTWLAFRDAEHAAIYTAIGDGTATRVSGANEKSERPRSAANGNRLFITYEQSAPGSEANHIALATSDDGHAFVTTTIGENGTRPQVCAAGRVVVVTYLDATPKAGNEVAVNVATSQDGGQNFSRFIVSTPREHIANETPSCVVSDNDVWVAYGINDAAAARDENKNALIDAVIVVRSRDGGKTTLDHSNVRPGAKMMHPTLLLRSSGALDLAYLSGAHEGDEHGRAAVVRVSTNGISKAPRTLHEPIVFAAGHSDAAFGGDYFGVAMTDQLGVAAMVDTASETSDAGLLGVLRHIVFVPVPEE